MSPKFLEEPSTGITGMKNNIGCYRLITYQYFMVERVRNSVVSVFQESRINRHTYFDLFIAQAYIFKTITFHEEGS